MNLIEQLGGYDEAKNFISTIADNKTPYRILERELLQYRREHNIFEVGDMVVYKGEAGLERVFQIETLTKTGKPKTVKTDRFGNFPCRYCTVTHATPGEIEAGYRL